jgi:formylmethanofuran dehydrogenase subunit E
MIDPRKFLEAGQLLHGHKCPAMPLGLRVGAAAMNALAVPRAQDKDLVAILELGDDHCAHCFGDGVQMVTGCTFGKGNIRKVAQGKFGLTLVERATGRAVRVVPIGEVQLGMKQSTFFQQYRMKGIPASRVPEEVVDPLIEQVLSMPADKLLKVGEEFHLPVEVRPESFATALCEACGEMVVESYLRLQGDRRLCMACHEKAR